MTASLSRIVLAAVLALGSASAMAGTKYIFVQPVKGATCTGTECQALQAAIAVAPTDEPAAPASDATQANLHIEQMWQNMHAITHFQQMSQSALAAGHYSLYSLNSLARSVPGANTTDETTGVVTQAYDYRTTGARSGLSAGVCAAIAAKAVSGITCAGGTITGEMVTAFLHVVPGNSVWTWTTASYEAMAAAVGASSYDVEGGYPANPI